MILPTETFYALACAPEALGALELIAKVKERPWTKPLPLACASLSALADYVEVRYLDKLKNSYPALFSFWPGPLTILLPLKNSAKFPSSLVNAQGEIAVRISSHPLLAALGVAGVRLLTVSSANLRGHPPASSLKALPNELLQPLSEAEYFAGLVDPKAWPKPSGGLPSTIVRPLLAMEQGPLLQIIREGAISRKSLEEAALVCA
ncbi:MAG: Sua5/YciO/YrdC/YwlC family protein [Desulfovibrio sp.]|nr:Sua5/YciO/YrdC/YwlC family protein [Desulfovibrio sp.]